MAGRVAVAARGPLAGPGLTRTGLARARRRVDGAKITTVLWSVLLDVAPAAIGVMVAVVVLRRGPQPRFGPWESLRRQLARYGTFGGRASRSELWWPWLVILLLDTVLHLASFPLAHGAAQVVDVVRSVIAAVVLLPGFAVTARRLHDTGRSAWWWLLVLTVVGIPWVLWWLTRPSQVGPNPWGHGPGTSLRLPRTEGQPRPWTTTGPARLGVLWSTVTLAGALLWGGGEVVESLWGGREPSSSWSLLSALGSLLLLGGVVGLRGAPLFGRAGADPRATAPAAPPAT
ncbi:DUF805 domain-containing protein [Quadrisphaera oryzae]|uniref:DUF805 domain-containing protein n=1 Tax=Quadrisphaera TaxID=317661 RepID=UPI001645FAA4|nr:DUF805 domain-containing protein [Quadrisphaera sp. RL12-1S]